MHLHLLTNCSRNAISIAAAVRTVDRRNTTSKAEKRGDCACCVEAILGGRAKVKYDEDEECLRFVMVKTTGLRHEEELS